MDEQLATRHTRVAGALSLADSIKLMMAAARCPARKLPTKSPFFWLCGVAGLQVKLLRHLVDVKRTQTYTRYYLAERIGGSPADMGWESQGVLLIPPALLGQEKLADVDQQVVQALSLN